MISMPRAACATRTICAGSKSAGIKGVLVASALHDGKITAGDLQTLNPK